MATASQQHEAIGDRGDPRAPASGVRAVPDTDDAEAKAIEALVRSRERTWHTFAKSLLLGGLLAGVATGAVVLYIY
jgi:hypothetical protein